MYKGFTTDKGFMSKNLKNKKSVIYLLKNIYIYIFTNTMLL